MPRDPDSSPPDVVAVVTGTHAWVADGLGAGVPLGNHQLPDEIPEGSGWAILYFLGGAVGGPPLRAPEADARLTFQATSCGRTALQAMMIAQRIRGRFTDRDERGRLVHELDLSAAGVEVGDRGLVGGLGDARYERGIFQVVEQFYVAV